MWPFSRVKTPPTSVFEAFKDLSFWIEVEFRPAEDITPHEIALVLKHYSDLRDSVWWPRYNIWHLYDDQSLNNMSVLSRHFVIKGTADDHPPLDQNDRNQSD